jgi:hypothetical protein
MRRSSRFSGRLEHECPTDDRLLPSQALIDYVGQRLTGATNNIAQQSSYGAAL